MSYSDQQLQQAIDAVFVQYDADKSGTLEFAEVKNLINDAFKKLNNGRSVTDEDVKKFGSHVDSNADGKITKTELFAIFKKISQAAQH
jgi:Ca2+-binding EF-hand superfamily protein